METINDFADARMELNSACDILEDVFGDYEEVADAMKKINEVIDFLYFQEQKMKGAENESIDK